MRIACTKCGKDLGFRGCSCKSEKDLLIEKLQKQNAKYREALEKYADEKNWPQYDEYSCTLPAKPMDCMIAQGALKGGED